MPLWSSLLPGSVTINGRYRILELLSQRGGEAGIFLCQPAAGDGEEVVLKLCRHVKGAKDRVLSQLKNMHHPDIIALLDYDVWENRFSEIMEYAICARQAYRSVVGTAIFRKRTFTEQVIPQILNALHVAIPGIRKSSTVI